MTSTAHTSCERPGFPEETGAVLCECERLRFFQNTADLEAVGCRIDWSHRHVPHNAKSELIGDIGWNEEIVWVRLRQVAQAQANRGPCSNSKKMSSIHDIRELLRKGLTTETQRHRERCFVPRSDKADLVTSLLVNKPSRRILPKTCESWFAIPVFASSSWSTSV